MKTIYKLTVILFISLFFAGCYGKYDALPNNPGSFNDTRATHTIAQFIAEFASEKGDFFPVRTNSGAANLYSVDSIPMYGDDIIIEGIVVSSDTAGNVYKSLFIQDLEQPEIGLKISVDAASISGVYQLGQKISIRCNGLAIGKYAEMWQLGTVYFNNTEELQKKGYEPGRIPYPMFKSRVETHGLPKKDAIVIHDMTIDEILNYPDRSIDARLVRIKNVYFTGTDQGKEIADAQKIFAIDTKGVGYPSSRDIKSRDGSSTGYISVATSEYSKFAKKRIPGSEQTGDIIALVGWYHDKDDDRYTGNFQLTIRSLDDLIGFKIQ